MSTDTLWLILAAALLAERLFTWRRAYRATKQPKPTPVPTRGIPVLSVDTRLSHDEFNELRDRFNESLAARRPMLLERGCEITIIPIDDAAPAIAAAIDFIKRVTIWDGSDEHERDELLAELYAAHGRIEAAS